MTMSFDVKIVNTEMSAYKTKNNVSWLVFDFLVASVARYLKKPNSSKNTERKVIEINRIRIFKGLMSESDVNPSKASCGEIP